MGMNHGPHPCSALEVLDVGRATMYRWKKSKSELRQKGLIPRTWQIVKKRQPRWTRHQEKALLRLRKKYPLWGKGKIQAVLARKDTTMSGSMCGRRHYHVG